MISSSLYDIINRKRIRIFPKEAVDMLALIGGIASVSLGIIFIIFWWFSLLQILAGVIPLALILGGGLAIYLKIDDLRYSSKEKDDAFTGPEPFKETEKPAFEASKEEEKKSDAAQYWLLGYSAKDIDVVGKKGLIGFPKAKEKLTREMIKKGDLVILYALSPQSKFAGIVEISGDYEYSDELIWNKAKEGDPWPHRRKVNVKVLADKKAWVDGKEAIGGLSVLEEARSKGSDLQKAFAAKLRSIPKISKKDYEVIAALIEK